MNQVYENENKARIVTSILALFLYEYPQRNKTLFTVFVTITVTFVIAIIITIVVTIIFVF
ncbi:hypothetical protein SAMN04488542_10792 [Fontibacillus panacisegetis]|uniref:Uncharacterized protein n=1 Tax=Fontibacillus panacisegetis TaxID=670482 RepID=A0A1G7JBE7_9BACL|nr:hypothetical protein SAMN04488542_10792 [Fontibacillus panacisegetis]